MSLRNRNKTCDYCINSNYYWTNLFIRVTGILSLVGWLIIIIYYLLTGKILTKDP